MPARTVPNQRPCAAFVARLSQYIAAAVWGERNPEMVIQAPIDQVPPDLNPEVGMRLEMGGANGEVLRVVVVEVADTHITLDANPPLAGEDLTFEIELVECAAP